MAVVESVKRPAARSPSMVAIGDSRRGEILLVTAAWSRRKLSIQVISRRSEATLRKLWIIPNSKTRIMAPFSPTLDWKASSSAKDRTAATAMTALRNNPIRIR